jgi:hypothetical protein
VVGPFRLDDWREGLVDPEIWPAREDQGALDHVLELAHISRPVIGGEGGHGRLRHLLDVPAEFPLAQADEVPHEDRNVLPPIAEWGHGDREHAQAVVQVRAEPAVTDGLVKVAVRGGDDPDVDLPCPG